MFVHNKTGQSMSRVYFAWCKMLIIWFTIYQYNLCFFKQVNAYFVGIYVLEQTATWHDAIHTFIRYILVNHIKDKKGYSTLRAMLCYGEKLSRPLSTISFTRWSLLADIILRADVSCIKKPMLCTRCCYLRDYDGINALKTWRWIQTK